MGTCVPVGLRSARGIADGWDRTRCPATASLGVCRLLSERVTAVAVGEEGSAATRWLPGSSLGGRAWKRQLIVKTSPALGPRIHFPSRVTAARMASLS